MYISMCVMTFKQTKGIFIHATTHIANNTQNISYFLGLITFHYFVIFMKCESSVCAKGRVPTSELFYTLGFNKKEGNVNFALVIIVTHTAISKYDQKN